MNVIQPITKSNEWIEATKRQMAENGESFEAWRDQVLREIKLALFDSRDKESKAWENYLLEGVCQRYWLDQAPKAKRRSKKGTSSESQSLDNPTLNLN